MDETPNAGAEKRAEQRFADVRARLAKFPTGDVWVAEQDAILFVGGRVIGQFQITEHAQAYAAAPADLHAVLDAYDAAVSALDALVTDMREVDWEMGVSKEICDAVSNVLGDSNPKTKRWREVMAQGATDDAE